MDARATNSGRTFAGASRFVTLGLLLGLALLLAYGCGGSGTGPHGLNVPPPPLAAGPAAPPPPPNLKEWSARLAGTAAPASSIRGRVDQGARFHPSRILVKVKALPKGAGMKAAAEAATRLSQRTGIEMAAERHFDFIGVSVLQIRSKHTVPQAVEALARQAEVEYAEPDYLRDLSEVIPNDPLFTQQWALKNTGQSGGLVGADVEATLAWDHTRGSAEVVVAVLDSGVDYNHPDLQSRMWRNPGEIMGNQVDDDGNGYVDDIHGIDAFNHDSDPMDDHSHGTHCAGIIAASNNDKGGVGIAPMVRIMAVKVGGPNGMSDAAILEGINYAFQMGATLTSNSYGSPGYSQSMYAAIKTARTANQLFVAAAGNDSANTDQSPQYPACYSLANVVSVGSSTRMETISTFSNYGATTVDLFAPGEEIVSTLPGAQYGIKSGTSMACPLVAGAAALMSSRYPGIPYTDLKTALFSGVDLCPAYQGMCVTGGRLNARRTLECPPPPLPSPSPSTSPSPSPSPLPSPSPSPSPSPAPSPSPGPPPTGSLSLQAGWNLVSFPVAELTGCYPEQGVSQNAFAWNPAQGAYEIVDLYNPSPFNADEGTARGLWIYSDRAASIHYAGRPNTGAGADAYMDLRQGWNLVGAPFSPARPLGGVLARWGTEPWQTLPGSVCSELPPTSQSCLMFAHGFRYAGGNYTPVSLSEAATELAPASAMWIYVHKDLTRLSFIPQVGSLAAISAPPAEFVAGSPAFQIVIEARDLEGRRMSTFADPITLRIKSFHGSPGTAPGDPTLNVARPGESSVTVNAVEGRSTFTLRPAKSGTYTLESSATGASTELNFDVVPGPAASLAFVSSPAGGEVGDVLAPVEVGFLDGSGNRVLSTAEAVTITAPSGTVSGQTSRTVDPSTGVAAFSDLRLSGILSDSCRLQASGGGFTALSAAFPQRLPVLRTGEFRINDTTLQRQEAPDVAWNPSSREFVVVWASTQSNPMTGVASWGIWGRRFDDGGKPLSQEFPIYLGDGTKVDREPEVACAPDGTVTVVWQGEGICGQRLSKNGTLLGTRTLLGGGYDPGVAVAGDGSASVVWIQPAQSGSTVGTVYLCRWLANGQVESPVRVSTTSTSDDYWPSVGADRAGNRLVTWCRPTERRQYGARYDANGIRTALYEFGTGLYGDVAMAGDGRFHVAWKEGTALYDSSGSLIGTGIAPAAPYTSHLATAMNEQGKICTAGNGDSSTSFADVMLATTPGGYNGRVNEYTVSDQWIPSLALSPEGILMVVWQSYQQDGSEHGIFGRVFAP